MASNRRKNRDSTDATPVDRVDPREENTLRGQQQQITATITQSEFDDKYYRVKNGKVLILNNEKFAVPGVHLADRTGTDVDASTICQRFVDIGFDSDVDSNLTKDETYAWFEGAKVDMKKNPVDCLVLVLLSHGTENGIYATDKEIYIEKIVEKFNATNCPELRFKPKVFIIQACRGTNLSYGVKHDIDPNQPDCKGDDTEYRQWLEQQPCTINLPNEADFLFSYATVPGTAAFRNSLTGSPFITHLSKALENMEVNEDIYSVLTSVNKSVGLTYTPKLERMALNYIVQMPCFVSHLTKILRLKQPA